ncbi:MAG: UDP-N-acetylmuramate--L-alanine ligase [Anaerolineaceae bacterium]|nr:UDP-N-acetylmuramate--L-alanine ligase [Anaerolineaceae bacterium]
MDHIHLIGISGTGLSPIAWVLLERGYTVSGSDQSISPLAQKLIDAGVTVFQGHNAANIQGADLVVRSSAITDQNGEVAAARAAGIPVLKRSDFLGKLMENSQTLAVAGTHGKTTTTSMLAWTLACLGQDPSYIIGGTSKNLGKNAHAGAGKYFVIEADEYDNMFLGLSPHLSIITTLEHDHPDCFPTEADYIAAFQRFANRLLPGGVLLLPFENAIARNLASGMQKESISLTYGTGNGANYQAQTMHINSAGGYTFNAVFTTTDGNTLTLGEVSLQVPGEHNVRNALAVLAAVHQLGLSTQEALRALAAFTGTGRRFDLVGEAGGVTVVDDYGHHPTEIRTTLAGARAKYGQQRIWAVWQPHTYSRTIALFDQFVQAFDDADEVIVTEVYPSRETVATISSSEVVSAMSHPSARFIATLTDTSAYLIANLQPGDVLIVFSAGDADQVSAQVYHHFQKGS